MTPVQTRRVEVCSSCNSVRAQGVWLFSTVLDDYLEGLVAGYPTGEFGIVHKKGKRKTAVEVVTGGKVVNVFDVYLSHTICPRCLIHKNRSYPYEIKVRIEGRALSRREVVYISQLIQESLRDEGQKLVYEYTENKDGVDLSVSTKKGFNTVLNHLRRKFRAKEVSSYKLVGEAHDKRRLFRTTVSYRIILFEKGNVMRLGQSLFEVDSVGKSGVKLRDMKTHATTRLEKHKLAEMIRRGEAETVLQNGQIITR